MSWIKNLSCSLFAILLCENINSQTLYPIEGDGLWRLVLEEKDFCIPKSFVVKSIRSTESYTLLSFREEPEVGIDVSNIIIYFNSSAYLDKEMNDSTNNLFGFLGQEELDGVSVSYYSSIESTGIDLIKIIAELSDSMYFSIERSPSDSAKELLEQILLGEHC